jgi:sulfur carrier protein
MRVRINGEDRELPDVASLSDLLRALGLDATGQGLAVAVNAAVVRKAEIASTPLEDGDRVEIVQAVQGG